MSRYLPYWDFVEWFEAVRPRAQLLEDEVVVSDADGNKRICRLPLILRGLGSLEKIQDEIDEPSLYAIILMQAGRASLGFARGEELLQQKQIQKYMVRKSQGKAQLSYLHSKGKSRLGSRIRLRQSEQFFDEINARLRQWQKEEGEPALLFLSCTPKLKGIWLQTEVPYEKKDPRWRRVPYTLQSPRQSELARIHRLLLRATWLSEIIS